MNTLGIEEWEARWEPGVNNSISYKFGMVDDMIRSLRDKSCWHTLFLVVALVGNISLAVRINELRNKIDELKQKGE